jgi:hypothetical protein
MFCAPVLIFVRIEGVGSRFHVLRSLTCFWRCEGRRLPFSCFALRTHFRWYRGRRFLFSCFARPDSFSAVPRASGPVFVFCAPELVLSGSEGVTSHFHVLRARTHFRRYRGRRLPFSCLTLPHSFWWYRGRRVPFSCFALLDSFSSVTRASAPDFML